MDNIASNRPGSNPSEPAKLIVMVVLASWFAKHQAETKSFWKGFVIPSLILGVPLLLILFEMDMGTAAGLGAAGLIVFFVSGTRMRYLGTSVVITLALAYQMVRTNPNRWERIIAFMDLESYKLRARLATVARDPSFWEWRDERHGFR